MEAIQLSARQRGRIEGATLGNDMYELRVFNGRDKQIAAYRLLWERYFPAVWLYYNTQPERHGRPRKKEKEAA